MTVPKRNLTPEENKLVQQALNASGEILYAPRMPRRPRNGNREAAVQAAVVKYVRFVLPDGLIAAIPNGGLRSKAEAARMKWTGTLAGMPDLVGIAQGKVYFFEVKPPREYLDPAQREIRKKLAEQGVPFALVRSIDDARKAFAEWGIQTREVQ